VLDSGQLELRLGRRTSVRVEPWSAGLGLWSVQGGRARTSWFSFLPLLVPAFERSEDRAVHRFLEEIPADVAGAVRTYPGFGQLALVHWACRWPPARDLLVANPGLLWLLAVGVYEYGITQREVEDLLGKKQRVILGRILRISEATGAQLKLQRKVDFGAAGLGEARLFREALGRGGMAHLVRHNRVIPIGLFSLLARYPALAREPLLERLTAVGEGTSRREVLGGLRHNNPALAREVATMLAELAPDVPQPVPRAVQNGGARGLKRRADKPADNGAGRVQPGRPGVRHHEDSLIARFPPPPLPDSESIRAIRSAVELDVESRRMSHCVRDYARDVWRGARYFYRVLQPERATLEVILNGMVGPRLGECRLARNRPPAPATLASVREWFASHIQTRKGS